MRRFYPSLLLALLIAAPLQQLRCAIACAPAEAYASAESCHDERATAPEGAPILASTHDCADHASPTVIGVTNRVLTLDGLPAASLTPNHVARIKQFVALSLGAAPPGGPPVALVVPLRV